MTRLQPLSPATLALSGAVLVALFSVLTGTSGAYVAAQLVALLGFAALIALAPRLPFAVALILLATVAKNFAISQVVKVLLWQPADIGMAAPIPTAWTIAAGTWGLALAAGVYAAWPPPERWQTPLSRPLQPAALVSTAWVLFAIGIVCKALFAANSARSVVFSYGGDLVYAAAAAFAYDVWRRSDHKTLLDWRVLLVLGATLVVAFQTGSKFAMLTPFVFVFLLYVSFKVRPPLALVAPLLALFLALSSMVYPMVTYARATGGGAAAITGVMEQVITDPSSFATIQRDADQIAAHWNTRLYYGRSMGMADRFTPNQVSDIVSVTGYTQYSLGGYVGDGLKALLPQSLGFQRDRISLGQAQLETAVQRRTLLGENSANYGLIADLRLHGGLLTVFLGCALFAGSVLGIYTLGFGGQRNDLWAIPYGVGGMFSIADQGLGGNIITMVHGAVIEWGLTLVVITAVCATVAASRAPSVRAQA